MGLLDGKRVLVTGARKGIGRGVAMRLAEEGATVGLNDVVADDAVEQTVAAVRAAGGTCTTHPGDVSTLRGISEVFRGFVAAHGGIDVLVNNAMYTDQMRPLFDVDEEYWDRLTGLGLKGYFFASQLAARQMVRQGTGGSIVCMSSVMGFGATQNAVVYGTMKAALRHMVRAFAADLHGSGVRCNCVAPGLIANAPAADARSKDGPDHELDVLFGSGGAARFRDACPAESQGKPSDIANAVLYLCSEHGRYVNGQTITVDGGLTAVGSVAKFGTGPVSFRGGARPRM